MLDRSQNVKDFIFFRGLLKVCLVDASVHSFPEPDQKARGREWPQRRPGLKPLWCCELFDRRLDRCYRVSVCARVLWCLHLCVHHYRGLYRADCVRMRVCACGYLWKSKRGFIQFQKPWLFFTILCQNLKPCRTDNMIVMYFVGG